MKVFFSHASGDKPRVRAVAREMPAHVECWVDESDLTLGNVLRERIRRAIDYESHYFVLFLSTAARDSVWVRQELDWALAREGEARRDFVLPVLLEAGLSLAGAPAPMQQLLQRLYLAAPPGDAEDAAAASRALAERLAERLFACASRDLPMPAEPRAKFVAELRDLLVDYKDRAFELQARLSDPIPLLAEDAAVNAGFAAAVARYNEHWARLGPALASLPDEVRALWGRGLADDAAGLARFVEQEIYRGAMYALNAVRDDVNGYDATRAERLAAAEARKEAQLAGVRSLLDELTARTLAFVARLEREL